MSVVERCQVLRGSLGAVWVRWCPPAERMRMVASGFEPAPVREQAALDSAEDLPGEIPPTRS